MFEKGEISKGQTISPIRATVNWILRGKKSFFIMATQVKPTTVKIRKNYIRILDSFLYKVHFSKKL